MDENDTAQREMDIRPIMAWAKEAGELALSLRYHRPEIGSKLDDTPVSSVDQRIQALLVDRIRGGYPNDLIVAEEDEVGGANAAQSWILDPLDGTRAYLSGLPIWGISIGVFRGGQPHLGVVYMPAADELYWGDENGAFVNGRPLPPPVASLDDPLAFLAVPSNSHLLYEISFHRLRSLGSTAAHLLYVARGAAVGALTRRVAIWDLAGVLPILRHSGIELRYLSGAPCRIADLLDGQPAPESLLAAPAPLIASLLEMIRAKRDFNLTT